MTTESSQPKQSRKRIVTYLLITFVLVFASYALIAFGREEGVKNKWPEELLKKE